MVGSVVVNQYAGQAAADAFRARLESLGVRVYLHYPIAGYPHNIGLIVSDDGYGKNDYIETSPPPGGGHRPRPGQRQDGRVPEPASTTSTSGASRRGTPSSKPSPSGTCPLQHPVNLAYEAATADLGT